MIQLNYCNGEVLVFDVNDWVTLRKTYRVLGAFVGSLNTIQTLPLKLLPEEVLLLFDEGVATVIDKKFNIKQVELLKHEQFENDLLEQEKIVFKNNRKRQLDVMIDDIVAAKRQRGDIRTLEEILVDELEKSTQITRENLIWPILLKSQHTDENIQVERQLLAERTSELKYFVFKDLWKKGYYTTNGFKFGADFLVYLGDPVAYHAVFIVHCIEDPNIKIHSTEIVAYGRLANSVKKRAVLAYLKSNEIAYMTINWIDS